MSRRQRKKEGAKQAVAAATAAAAAAAQPRPERLSRPSEEIVLGPDGFVDRLVPLGVPRESVLRALAFAAVRLFRSSTALHWVATYFFATLGEAMAQEAVISADAHLYEKCQTALRSGFYVRRYVADVSKLKLTPEGRRILSQYRN